MTAKILPIRQAAPALADLMPCAVQFESDGEAIVAAADAMKDGRELVLLHALPLGRWEIRTRAPLQVGE